MRTLIFSLALLAPAMFAGDFKKSVEQLGDKTAQNEAINKLSEAGADAFEDLLNGVKADPEAEADAVKKAKISVTRLACVRLIGPLRDERATPELLKIVRDEKTRAAYPDLISSCIWALGKIAAAKPNAAGSADAIAEIKKAAGDDKASLKLRFAALNALVELKQGGEVALPLLKEGSDEVLRLTAVAVIHASKHKPAADELLKLWDAQMRAMDADSEFKRLDKNSDGKLDNTETDQKTIDDMDADKKDGVSLAEFKAKYKPADSRPDAVRHTQPLGVAALFALANMGDERCIQGLVDVATLLEFDGNTSYRDAAKGYLKDLKAKAIPLLVAIIKDDLKAAHWIFASRLLGSFGGEGIRAMLEISKADVVEVEQNVLNENDTNHDGSVSLEEYTKNFKQQTAESEFKLRDKNSDGQIKDAETDAKGLEEFDADKNGSISLDEFKAKFKPVEKKPEDEFKKLDTNNNGKLERDTKFSNRIEGQLLSLTDEDTINALIEAYRAMPADDAGRKRIVSKILAQRPKSAVPLFKELANDAKLEGPQRSMAIDAYAEAKGKDCFDDLKAWAEAVADVPEVRRAATRNLGREFIPLFKSEDVLKAKVGDTDSETRVNALRGLQRSDKKELLELFIKRLKEDTEPSVRRVAIEALEQFNTNAKLDGEGVYEPVKTAFKDDKDASVRAQALRFAVTLAEQRGDNTATKDMLLKALSDSDIVVRSNVYTMMYRPNVRAQVEAQNLIDAALKETEYQGKGDAVQALSYIEADKWADAKLDKKKIEAVADLGMAVMADRRSPFSPTLLTHLSKKGGQYSRIADKTESLLKDMLAQQNPDFFKVSGYIDVLIGIEDVSKTARDLVKQAAKLQHTEPRSTAIRYFVAQGDKSDVPFLRELMNLGDATAPSVRRQIEEAIRTLESK